MKLLMKRLMNIGSLSEQNRQRHQRCQSRPSGWNTGVNATIAVLGACCVLLVMLLTALLATTLLHAQAPAPAPTQAPAPASVGTGLITGTITDGESGDVLRGATVQLVGTKRGSIADVKGTYTVRGLAAGSYTLRFNYIGFKPKTVENIIVADGKTVTLAIVLESAVKKTEEVVVQAARINDNAAAMLAQRKNAAQVSDGIGEAEIKKLPDSDAGQALKRVPGVTLVEGKFVYVRGVSERYSNTTLNGATLSSTEPDKKAFAFDMFPAEFLQNATVAKSFTPDLSGNFAGGLVQLNTVDFPEKFFLKASLATTYNDNVTFRPDGFNTYDGGRTDWLGIDDGTRKLPENMPADRRGMDNLLRRAGDLNDEMGAATWIAAGKAFNSNVWQQRRMSAPLNTSVGLAFANVLRGEENEFGIMANLNYGNGYAVNTMTRGGIQSNGTLQFGGAGTQSSRSVNWGGLLNLAYKIGASSSLTFKNIYNRSSDDEVVELNATDNPQQRDRRFYSAQFVEKTMYSGQLGGEHTFSTLSNAVLDWKVGYSTSRRDEPDLRRLRYSSEIGRNEYTADIPRTPQGDGTVAGRFFSGLQDNLWTGAFNLQVPLDGGVKLKAGALMERRTRSFGARSFTIVQSRAILQDVDLDLDLSQSPSSLLVAGNFRGDGLGIAEDSKLSDAYSASEELNTGYVMGDVPFQLGGFDLRVIGGVRVEHSIQRLNSFETNGDLVSIAPAFTDFLPSLHLVFKATNDMNIRASATRTLARPSLREFAPFAFFDFQSQSRVQGNPNLIRALINNYDLRYEWFVAPGEVFAVSAFYKTFENAIEETIQPGSVIARTFANARGIASNYGVEVELRKSFGFVAPELEPLMFSSNLSLVNSNITVTQGSLTDSRQMWGQSPYSLNLGLFYTAPVLNTSFNVGYNRIGSRIVQVAQLGLYEVRSGQSPHVFELPRDVVDVSVMQPIGALELKLVVRDIFNQPLVWEQLGTRIATNIRGRSLTFGVSYRFE
jgi:TonB-dependent receptor